MAVNRAARWCALGALSLGASGWLAVWLQWALPQEDLGGIEYALVAALLFGVLIGFGRRISSRPMKAVGFVAVAAPLVQPARFLLRLLVVPDGRPIAVWLIGVSLVPAGLGWLIAHVLRGRWVLPVGVFLIPITITLELFAGALQTNKTLWPWRSYHKPLLALRSNATAAAKRIHLPETTDMMSVEDRARLAKEVPLQATFAFPLIRRTITARVSDTGSDVLWIYFGDGRFGPLNTKMMRIGWVDD